ncbi:MAG: proteasome assembly chaperone family protein, partial [Halobacteriaceae archaeon]
WRPTTPRTFAVYGDGDRAVRPPVRLYADADRDLLVLQSDVPVSRTAAASFADCVTAWVADNGVFPVYLSGLAVEEPPSVPSVFGVATGGADERLADLGVDAPPERGAIGGPTGALLNRAADAGVAAAGLVTESDPQFPDPAAARRLLVDGVGPLAGVEVDTDDLVERAEEIRDQKEQLARQMQEADEEESSQAKPVGMFQ